MIGWDTIPKPSLNTTTTPNSDTLENEFLHLALPVESQLADYTIWIETQKLYGHSNDVVCCSLIAHYLATACKARFTNLQPMNQTRLDIDLGNSGGLGILIWDISKQPAMIIARLEEGHESTVVSLEFAPNAK
jgi:hypothetical protein